MATLLHVITLKYFEYSVYYSHIEAYSIIHASRRPIANICKHMQVYVPHNTCVHYKFILKNLVKNYFMTYV